MAESIITDIPATVLRVVAIAFLYVVNIFYSSYKYHRKMAGHYTSLKISIRLGKTTGIRSIYEFCSIFETIKTDKIEFEEKSLDKLLDTAKGDGK